MVFDFEAYFRFFHISREIMVLRRFWQIFSFCKGGGILWEESISKCFSISKHNFVFCIDLLKYWFYDDFDEIFMSPKGWYFMSRIKSQMVFIVGHNFVFCIYLVKYWFYGDFDWIFGTPREEVFYEKNQIPNDFISGLDFVLCTYLRK